MIEIRPIQRDKINDEWHEVLPWIAEACRRSVGNPEKLKEYCIEDPKYFCIRFLIDDELIGAAILSIEPDALHMESLSAKFPKDWRNHVGCWLDHIATEAGLNKITIDGRKGWARLLRSYGYRMTNDGYLTRCIDGRWK